MSGGWFLDTNVLVYAFDVSEPEKQYAALALLASEDSPKFVVSTQVLGEFYVTVTRKLRPAIDAVTVRAALDHYGRLPVIATDLALVRAAITTAESAQISYWDALTVEAAAASGCERILTEDLATGSIIRGVEIVDPFA